MRNIYIFNIRFLLSYIKNLSCHNIRSCKKYQGTAEFCFNSGSGIIKKYTLQFTFDQNLRHEQLCTINLLDSSIFFLNLPATFFFHPRYPQVLMVASKRTPRVLSEKHNFNKGYPKQNLKINNKIQRKFIWAMIFSLANKMIFWNS